MAGLSGVILADACSDEDDLVRRLHDNSRDTYDAELRWIPAAGTATLATPSGRVALSAFTAVVSAPAVTVRYALSGSASVALSLGSGVVARAGGRPGFGMLAWNRRLGSTRAPKGRYSLAVTATTAGHIARQTLNVRLS